MKKVGIIGCGSIAQVHAWVLSNMEDVEICALCDVDASRARNIADKYLNEKNRGSIHSEKYTDDTKVDSASEDKRDTESLIYTNWHDLLDIDIDAVHICTPHYLHAPMAVEFIKRGKAVFCEKPCAISLEQFDELKNADLKHPGLLGYCFQNRYNETTLLMDKLIAEGRIGEVTGVRAFVTWRRDRSYYEGSPWKGRLETEGGGALINQSIHTLDLMLRYLGEPEQVKASISNHHLPSIEVEDTVEAWMMFEGGRRGCFYASNGYATDAPVIIDIQGETGRISLNGREVSLYAEGKDPEHFLCERQQGIGKDYWGCGHKACIRDFYKCLESGERFQNDLDGATNTFNTMMKIYEDSQAEHILTSGGEASYIRVGDMVICSNNMS